MFAHSLLGTVSQDAFVEEEAQQERHHVLVVALRIPHYTTLSPWLQKTNPDRPSRGLTLSVTRPHKKRVRPVSSPPYIAPPPALTLSPRSSPDVIPIAPTIPP